MKSLITMRKIVHYIRMIPLSSFRDGKWDSSVDNNLHTILPFGTFICLCPFNIFIAIYKTYLAGPF